MYILVAIFDKFYCKLMLIVLLISFLGRISQIKRKHKVEIIHPLCQKTIYDTYSYTTYNIS